MMTPTIPSPCIHKIQARNISPVPSLRGDSSEKKVSALASLILADRFQEKLQKENQSEEPATRRGSPGRYLRLLLKLFAE